MTYREIGFWLQVWGAAGIVMALILGSFFDAISKAKRGPRTPRPGQ